MKALIIGAGVIGSFYEIQELAGELRVIMRQARLPCPASDVLFAQVDGNAQPFRTLRPIRALHRKAGRANCPLSSITRSRSLCRKQAVAPAPTLQLNGGGLHPKHPPTRGLHADAATCPTCWVLAQKC